MADLALSIMLAVRDQASTIINNFAGRFNTALKSLSPGLQFAAGTALAFTGIVAGIGVASIKMASDYQAAMNQVRALTGSSQEQMAQYDSSLKQLAMDSGVGPTKLAQGLYYVISAGYQGANAMKILTLSTQDSVIAQVSAQVTAKAFTTVMQTFSKSIKEADAVNGEMLQTVTLGKMDMQDYSNAISKVGQTSRLYHQSLETTNSVLATLTSAGYKSATIAATDYGQLLTAMEGKTDLMAKRIRSLGLAFDENKFRTMTFQQQLGYLNTVMKGHSSQLQFVLNGSNKAATAFGALTSHSNMLANNFKQLSNQTKNAHATQSAWAITQSGFQQNMNRLGSTLQVVGITIGQKLLPPITKLVGWVASGINSFMNWATHSKTLQNILHGLGVAFATLGSWVSKVADFFQHNAAAMTALKIVGIAVAGAVLGLLVAGFVALAIAAWSAAAGVIAATWPFLLIGAAVALLIAGIILLVQHWTQLTSWIGAQMSRFGSFMHAIWDAIVKELRKVWEAIVGAVKAALQRLWDTFTAPFRNIAKLFLWLYNHNYYFKALVDKVRQIVKAGLDKLHQIWQGAVDKVVGLWNWLKDRLTQIVGFLGEKWNSMKDFVAKAWSAVSSVISSAWSTYIVKPLQGLWNSIVGFANGWPKQALQWGINLIQGFIDGIKNMLGKVGQTAQNVAKTVANFLGFHSPTKEGPGRELGVWGPNLVKQFAGDLSAGQPKIQAALNTMISPLAKIMHSTTTTVSPVRSSAVAVGGASGGHTFNITVNGFVGKNKKEMVDFLDKELGRRFDRNTNVVTQRSGGRSS